MALPQSSAALALALLPFPALAAAEPQAASAQPTEAEAPGTTGGIDADGDIVVVATRVRGEVETAVPPIVTLGEEDIAAYGAGSLQSLLAALAPQTGSGRGRGDGSPSVLLNGLRIASFREIRSIPPEAIKRVEVLPEEVSLKYGFRPDQRVVNFILKDKFRSFGTETEAKLPGAGGFSDLSEEVTLTRIDKASRLNLTGTLERRSPLTEAERGIVQPAISGAQTGLIDPKQGDYRTLLADARSAIVNGTWAKSLGTGSSLTLNGLVQRNDNRSLNGLNSVVLTAPDGSLVQRSTLLPAPLASRTVADTYSAGATLNLPVGAWQLAWTADGTHVDTTTTIDARADLSGLQTLVDQGTLSPFGTLPADAILPTPQGIARSKSDTATTLATVTGTPLRLPGGQTALTLKAGFAYNGLRSSDSRQLGTPANLRRGDAQAGFSLDLPITSRRENFGSKLGDISLNVNAEVHNVSDFGSLTAWGAGVTWGVTPKLTFAANYVASEKAPGLSDLGAPITITTGVALYDFTLGTSVLANVITGGNPALKKERQRDIKLSANWDLPIGKESALLLEYFRNRSLDTTSAFPLLTPDVEAAFPGRVTRDGAGRIVSVDQRAVTFAETTGSRLRASLNFGGPFGKPDPNARRSAFAGMRRPGGGGPGGSGPRPSGGGGRGPGGDGRGHWNLSLAYTQELDETARIVPGGRVLDLLNGDALSGAGISRSSATLEGGGFYRGFGLRISGTYASGTHVDSSGVPGASRLDFGDLATLNVRGFIDLGRMPKLVSRAQFFKGTRIAIGVNNLFDTVQKVTDQTGATPLRYQRGYLNPEGRVFSIELRKQF
ncbi:TonB-dependent receptor [Novosphingobium sediminis]|uniref:TonB-dependent receptor n=1 Tax=Novosphingobium sediminis TaxID=707214 RepID=A0A512AL43_9SPHN|nr:TonB-dependent receptor plug domain-containing protein [Novosphingobium sediminis]GEO00423.1 TonB-dependent receptor [Novosphingobium sediminis]